MYANSFTPKVDRELQQNEWSFVFWVNAVGAIAMLARALR